MGCSYELCTLSAGSDKGVHSTMQGSFPELASLPGGSTVDQLWGVGMDPISQVPGLIHVLAGWPWACHLVSLCLIFKIGVIKPPTSLGYYKELKLSHIHT